VPQANVELVLSMQRPWRQDEKRDSRDWVRLPMRPTQLWVADKTCVTVIGGFAYVAVVFDAWSRRVVGYAISRSIDGGFNWSAQHSNRFSRMECGYETAMSHLLLGSPTV
jgi:transposase InsO family protein